MNLNLKSVVFELENLFLYGWDGAAALFGILTMLLAATLLVCIIYIIILSIRIIVYRIQETAIDKEIKELSKGKDVE